MFSYLPLLKTCFSAGQPPAIARGASGRFGCDPFGGLEHCANYLVVSGASAEVTGQSVTYLGLVRMRIVVEQSLGRHQKAGRADAALEARVFEELLLQRMELGAVGQSFDGLDLLALRLDTQHEARASASPVDDHAACA